MLKGLVVLGLRETRLLEIVTRSLISISTRKRDNYEILQIHPTLA
ncbi:hypothetical protein [Calothrix sp. UHCC 0171]|nr:hypothetical protein [Calothrix sp. UHCC 0171]MEA5571927.1 hypothetical protein [Calothrix sp. UHCC 0171]